MPSAREQALIALATKLETLVVPGLIFRRNPDKEEVIPEKGAIEMFDGEPGEPEEFMSPHTFIYDHAVEIEVKFQNQEGDTRQSEMDSLLVSLGQLIESDRTLGGAVEWVEPDAPSFDIEDVEGGETVLVANIPMILRYSTTNPLN